MQSNANDPAESPRHPYEMNGAVSYIQNFSRNKSIFSINNRFPLRSARFTVKNQDAPGILMRRYSVILRSLSGAIHYAYAAAWNESVDDIDHFIGLGFRYQFNSFDIDMRYSYNWANTDVDYDAASNRAFANPENGNQPINNGFPAMTFARHILETGLRWNLHKDASMRFYHHYEHSSTRDWH